MLIYREVQKDLSMFQLHYLWNRKFSKLTTVIQSDHCTNDMYVGHVILYT